MFRARQLSSSFCEKNTWNSCLLSSFSALTRPQVPVGHVLHTSHRAYRVLGSQAPRVMLHLKPAVRLASVATGCRSGQICMWDLHKRHTTGETVVRLSGDLILQVLKFKISSHSIVFLLSNRLSSALVTLVRSPACCIPVTTVQHTTAITCSVEEQTSLSDYGTCTREYWCTRLLCMED